MFILPHNLHKIKLQVMEALHPLGLNQEKVEQSACPSLDDGSNKHTRLVGDKRW